MKRSDRLVWISGPAQPGKSVLKPPAGGHRQNRRMMFYNPDGEAFVAQAPKWWADRLIERGSAVAAKAPSAPKPAPKAKESK